MSVLTVFEFSENQVRVLDIDGEPWFVALDVLRAIGSSTTVTAVETMIREDLGEVFVSNQHLADPTGTKQSTTILSEAALTMFVSRSRTELGKALNRWVHVEVLPSIRKTGKFETNAIAQKSEAPKIGSSVETTLAMINPLRLCLTSIPVPLLDGFILNELQKVHPELAPQINAAHSLLAANTPIEEVLHTPTTIGKQLNLSARVINTLLTANGYQLKNPNKGKTEPAYIPTEKGKQFCSNTLATGRGKDSTSYQHTKWYGSIIPELENLI